MKMFLLALGLVVPSLLAQSFPLCNIYAPNGYIIAVGGLVTNVEDSANGRDTGGVIAPGQRVVLRGIGFTNDLSVVNKPVQLNNNQLPTKVGGTEVLVNGELAPIEQIGIDQRIPFMWTLHIQIPWDLDVTKAPLVQLRMTQVDSSRCVSQPNPSLKATALAPGLYINPDGSAVVQNDGSGYITFYVNGLGKTATPIPVGLISAQVVSIDPSISLIVAVDGNEVPITYAGITPGTSGVFQVNAISLLGSGQHSLSVSANGAKTSATFATATK
jgi:uncharacterized protein (TIGR03437 family)